jgi:hypothetical protein
MASLHTVALPQALAASHFECDVPTDADRFRARARARALRQRHKRRLASWLKSLIPGPVLARITRLDDISLRLLDVIGVKKEGPSDYLLRTGGRDAVRAWRQATTPLLPACLTIPLRQTAAHKAG